MTRLAQRHKVMHVIRATLTERKHMVYLLGGCQLASLLALLAERVFLDKAVTDTFPRTTVSFVRLRLTLEMIVVIVHLLLMLGAVLLTDSKPTAAGIGTGTFWFVGHSVSPPRGHKESPAGFCFRKALNHSSLAIIMIPQDKGINLCF